MARTVRDARLETKAARDRLPMRKKPYWRTLVPGLLHLGYRRRRKGDEGTWLVRRYLGVGSVPKGKSPYRIEPLGRADDNRDPDGNLVLSFADAQRIAVSRLQVAQGAGTIERARGPVTVADAMAAYITNLADTGRPTGGAQSRSRLHILPELGEINVEALTTDCLQHWLFNLAKSPGRVRSKRGSARPRYKVALANEETWRQRRSTANRTLTVLKAALNRAFDMGRVSSNDAWGRRLKAFAQVDAARERFLSVTQAQLLISAADPDFRNLVQAALQTGARYGELTRMMVADFNDGSGTVAIRQSKSGKPRHVFLSAEGTEFFSQLCAGLAGDQLLLRKSNGKGWNKSEQLRPMLAAVTRAKITPPISFHGLRHTYASLAVMGGVPLQVLARNLGHVDTRMVEKHYGHLEDSYVRQAIRAGAPRFGQLRGNNVVPLPAKTK